MPRISVRLVFFYLLAVGLPLLTLAEVFKVGRNLTAPAHTGGRWTVETAPVCGSSSFAVSQTGRMLSITLAGHAAAGTIEGDTVRMSASEPPCSFMVVATLDRRMKPAVIAGEVRSDTCETCPPVPFRAVRSVDAGVSR